MPSNRSFRQTYPYLFPNQPDTLAYSAELETATKPYDAVGTSGKDLLSGIPDEFSLNETSINDMLRLAIIFTNMGAAEREKEIEVLENKLGIKFLKEPDQKIGTNYIQLINRAFNTKGLYDHAIASMNSYLKLSASEKGYIQNGREMKKHYEAAAQITKKLFTEVFQKHLIDFKKSLTDTGNFSNAWNLFIQDYQQTLFDSPDLTKLFQEAILNDSDKRYLKQIADEFATADEAAEHFKRQFAASIMQQFFNGKSEEKVREALEERQATKGRGQKKYSTVAMENIGFKAEKPKRKSNLYAPLLNGISEVLSASVATAINNMNKNATLHFQAVQQGGAQGNIDVAYFQQLSEEFAVDLTIHATGDDSRKTAVRHSLEDIEKRYAQAVSQMADSESAIAVYESTKLYLERTTGQQNRYFSGTTYNLAATFQLLSEICESRGDELRYFLIRLINEGGGGFEFLASYREKDKEELRKIVAENVAAFLFDDYWNIGQSVGSTGVTAIHLFRLNNIVIPLSSFLLALGNAAAHTADQKQYEDMIKINITLGNIQQAIPTKVGLDVDERWAATWDTLSSQFKLKILFLKNFQQDMIDEFANWS